MRPGAGGAVASGAHHERRGFNNERKGALPVLVRPRELIGCGSTLCPSYGDVRSTCQPISRWGNRWRCASRHAQVQSVSDGGWVGGVGTGAGYAARARGGCGFASTTVTSLAAIGVDLRVRPRFTRMASDMISGYDLVSLR